MYEVEFIVATFWITQHKRYCFLTFANLVVLGKGSVMCTNGKKNIKIRKKKKINIFAICLYLNSMLSVFLEDVTLEDGVAKC